MDVGYEVDVGAGFKPALPAPCADATYVHRPGAMRRDRAGRKPCPSLRAVERLRYVPVRPARQSSAGSVTYVCCPPGTGLLRACNVLRIASVAALRKDGARRRDGGGRV
ncbi:MAG: hypothetical protein LBM98_13470 [Oscillospiraceae bacterium]|nr:hypothetical protein [Oscillospiraceae bacterium]